IGISLHVASLRRKINFRREVESRSHHLQPETALIVGQHVGDPLSGLKAKSIKADVKIPVTPKVLAHELHLLIPLSLHSTQLFELSFVQVELLLDRRVVERVEALILKVELAETLTLERIREYLVDRRVEVRLKRLRELLSTRDQAFIGKIALQAGEFLLVALPRLGVVLLQLTEKLIVQPELNANSRISEPGLFVPSSN